MPRPALIHSLRTWPGLAWAIPLLLLLLCWPAAQAQPLLTLDPHPEQARRLGPDGQYWIDHTGRATPDEVMRLPDTAWQATRSDHIFPLHTLADMVWIRFRTAPIGPAHLHWYLEIPYANLDRATLFVQADDGRWTPQDAGDALPSAEWPLPHRQPLLQLRPKADAPVVHLLRIGHANPTSVPVLVTEERQLLRRERNVSVGLGVYFGIAALAVLVALSSAWRGRDLAFVLYALFTLLTALSAASLSGFAGLVLWPRHAAWNHHAATVLPLLTLGAALAFVVAATDLHLRSRRLFLWASAAVAAAVLLALAMPWLPATWTDETVGVYAIVALLLGIGVPAWAIWHGDRYAPAVLAGMVCLAAPASPYILRMFQLAPVGLLMRFVLLGGAALQLGILMTTLLVRGRDRSLTAQRLRGLDRVDPATGLSTPAVVMERLRRMTARAQRQEHQIAVLLIDLVNLGELRQLYGRRVDQEMPLRLANRLLHVMREIDTVGRLSNRRFIMLIEGPVTQEAIEDQAQRVLAHCLRPISGRPEGWRPRLRMALGVMPRDGRQPDLMLDKLALMLDTVAPGDNRLLFRCQ